MKPLCRLVFVFVVMTTSACVTIATFDTGYRPGAPVVHASLASGGLLVHPFEDHRPPREAGSSLDLYKAYVPLVPYIRSDFERFEEAARDQSDELQLAGSTGPALLGTMNPTPPYDQYEYRRSMARAVADDLRASGLFDRVTFSETDEAANDNRYELRGVLLATPLHHRFTSYGLGVPGVLLWLLPIPNEKVSATVTLGLSLIDVASGAVLWTHSLTGEASGVVMSYHRSLAYGPNGAMSLNIPMIGDEHGVNPHSLFSWHFAALRQAMTAAKSDLAQSLAAQNSPAHGT